MTLLFKLGEGPVNYEWNKRYCLIEATELIYSPTLYETDKKTVNIQGAAVSSICSIKDKQFAFCITIPPPLDKPIYLAAETYEECAKFHKLCVKAAQNEYEEEKLLNMDDEQHIDDQIVNQVQSEKTDAEPIPKEILEKIEIIRNELVLDDGKFNVKYKNGLKISVPKELNYTSLKMFLLKNAVILVLLYVVMMILIKILSNNLIDYFIYCLFIFNSYITLKRNFKEFRKDQCSYLVKSSCIVEIDTETIVTLLSKFSQRPQFDHFVENSTKIKEISKHKFNVIFTLPNNFLLRNLFKQMEKEIELLIFKDSYDITYVLFRENSFNKNHYEEKFFEMFVIMSTKETFTTKSQIIYITNFEYLTVPYFYRQILKENRAEILGYFKEYSLSLNESDILNKMLENNDNIPEYDINLLNKEIKTNIEQPKEKFQPDQIYAINPNSIITHGKRLKLNQRLKDYYRYPEGGVECRNMEELRTQDGLILELMKRAGKQLIEGKNIVAVSLPVKIFEPRSTILRITDLWGSGPHYLSMACKTEDPIERMKIIIAFAISGLHMNLKQLKPFNPILGETYQGDWYDGSKLYLEHMSHHPPISRFLIIGPSNKFRVYGYYEYIAKLKTITGNTVEGSFKGPTTIDFMNGQKITYYYPSCSISGLLYGKRIIQWEKSFEAFDYVNGITAKLNFTPEPKFFQSFKEPTDIFRGEIKKNENFVCKVYGSPVDKLMFDNEVFWELETVDIIKPNDDENPLQSDCKYRTDLIELAKRNIEESDKEKVRLEVIQRSDRSLRQNWKAKIEKNRKN